MPKGNTALLATGEADMFIKLTNINVNDPAYTLVKCGFEVADELMGVADISYDGKCCGGIEEPRVGEFELTLNMQRVPMTEVVALLEAIKQDSF